MVPNHKLEPGVQSPLIRERLIYNGEYTSHYTGEVFLVFVEYPGMAYHPKFFRELTLPPDLDMEIEALVNEPFIVEK